MKPRIRCITWREIDHSEWVWAGQTIRNAGGTITVEGEGVWRVTWRTI